VIVAVASRKASPGATTLAGLLAAYWYDPGTVRLLIEADPSGGTLAARWSMAHGLSWDPGLLALSATRNRFAAEMLPSVAQLIDDDLWVAAAPPAPDQVAAGLTRLGDRGAAALAAATDIQVVVDCGRLTAVSPALPLARRAALTILVCRPRLDEVHALQPAVAELDNAGCALGLICQGDGPYSPDEVAETLGVELLGVLPVDDRAANAFDRDGMGAGRVFHRSGMAHSAEELASLVRVKVADTLDLDQSGSDPQSATDHPDPDPDPDSDQRPATALRGPPPEWALVPSPSSAPAPEQDAASDGDGSVKTWFTPPLQVLRDNGDAEVSNRG